MVTGAVGGNHSTRALVLAAIWTCFYCCTYLHFVGRSTRETNRWKINGSVYFVVKTAAEADTKRKCQTAEKNSIQIHFRPKCRNAPTSTS